VQPSDFNAVSQKVQALIGLFDTQNNMTIVAQMKLLVPEFISNNSVYEQLDEQLQN
jgi:hypothetical protein